LRVTGGSLRGVTLDSVPVWSRGPRALDIHVAGGPERSASRADSATAYLIGSPRFAVPDSAGTATLAGLTPGAYLVEVGTRELDLLGWPRARIRVDIDTAGRTVAHVKLDESVVAARAICLDDAKLVSATTGVLTGTVSRGDEPVAGREVTVTWIGDPVGAHSGGATITRTVRTLAGDGRYFACGVPRERPIEVRVAGSAGLATTRLGRDQVVGVVNVPLTP
jgi:hypothetical protein